MCGLAGFAGIHQSHRFALTTALGKRIDARGGDAAGFVALGDTVRVGRIAGSDRKPNKGTWTKASTRFLTEASNADVLLMHARLATCGNPWDPTQAHPYTIKRDGKTVLWGAHNGMIWDADDSAKANNRPYTVDSRELFELIADRQQAAMQNLSGYGVVTWIEPGIDYVKLARLTTDSEIVVASVVGGGTAWASTWAILGGALAFAGLAARCTYKIDEIGKVYHLGLDSVTHGTEEGFKLAQYKSYYFPSDAEGETDWEKAMFLDYLKEQEAENEEAPKTTYLATELASRDYFDKAWRNAEQAQKEYEEENKRSLEWDAAYGRHVNS